MNQFLCEDLVETPKRNGIFAQFWSEITTIRKYAKKFNEKMDKIEAARAAKILSCTERCYCSKYMRIYIYIYLLYFIFFFAIVAGWLLRGVHRFASFRGGKGEIHGAFKLFSNPEDSGR